MATDDALEELRIRYSQERATWEAVAEHVRASLEHLLRSAGIRPLITARAKETASLLRKALVKGRTNALDEIHDKAGVRVVVLYPSQVRAVSELIRNEYSPRNEDDKRASLDPAELKYLGVHFDTVLPDGTVPGTGELLGEPWCEIQLLTEAEALWAATSHPLLYKAPVQLPTVTKRRLTRLIALSEIIDDELERAERAVIDDPDHHEAKLLAALETKFFELIGRDYDAEVSQAMLTILVPAYSEADRPRLSEILSTFVDSRRADLEHVYQHNIDSDDPFLFQPESIIIFERLEHARHTLEREWTSALPRKHLESLAAMWGQPLV